MVRILKPGYKNTSFSVDSVEATVDRSTLSELLLQNQRFYMLSYFEFLLKKTTLLHNRYFYAYFLPLRKGPVLLVDLGGLLLPGYCPPDKSSRVHRADSGADGIKVCFSDA